MSKKEKNSMDEKKLVYKRMGYEVVEDKGVKTLIVKGVVAYWYRQNGADASILQNIGDQKPEDVIDKWIASVPEKKE